MIFRNRYEAGRHLASRLAQYRHKAQVVVLALPRGGVPVAFEVAQSLRAPLDVFLVRKLGYPGQEELAMGAVASGGVLVRNVDLFDRLDIPEHVIERVAERERAELERQQAHYRHNRPPPDIGDRIVILVDDGLATGSTMRAAVEALRRQHPKKIVVAVPVGAADTCDEFADIADEVVCAISSRNFLAVGSWYADFTQIPDDEVESLLEEAEQWRRAEAAAP
jgi:predicted phosphoribosyltransferase